MLDLLVDGQFLKGQPQILNEEGPVLRRLDGFCMPSHSPQCPVFTVLAALVVGLVTGNVHCQQSLWLEICMELGNVLVLWDVDKYGPI